ncbi:MAG: hypothetical protein M1813_006583 [Trichoglossum hirsutum]|nr:MAG: hypothetical protein M1813_006583 [Trichoglossum hirsutum]
MEYPYPLFSALNRGQRVVLFATSASLMTLSTVTLKWLYRYINGTRPGTVKMGNAAAVKQA